MFRPALPLLFSGWLILLPLSAHAYLDPCIAFGVGCSSAGGGPPPPPPPSSVPTNPPPSDVSGTIPTDQQPIEGVGDSSAAPMMFAQDATTGRPTHMAAPNARAHPAASLSDSGPGETLGILSLVFAAGITLFLASRASATRHD